jgi:hypothetical protein
MAGNRSFAYSESLSVICVGLNGSVLGFVLSDNLLHLLNDYAAELCAFPLDDYFTKPPVQIAVHSDHSIVELGFISPRILLMEFTDAFEVSRVSVSAGGWPEGIQQMTFDWDYLFVAGRTDAIVSLFVRCQDDSAFKDAWQIGDRARTTVHWQVVDGGGSVVPVLMGGSVGVWDVLTQTAIARFSMSGRRLHASIGVAADLFSAVWIEESRSVSVIHRAKRFPRNFAGIPFHGLRGLCIVKAKRLLVTGTRHKDLQVWGAIDRAPMCLD